MLSVEEICRRVNGYYIPDRDTCIFKGTVEVTDSLVKLGDKYINLGDALVVLDVHHGLKTYTLGVEKLETHMKISPIEKSVTVMFRKSGKLVLYVTRGGD